MVIVRYSGISRKSRGIIELDIAKPELRSIVTLYIA